jgi:hypothetical protein
VVTTTGGVQAAAKRTVSASDSVFFDIRIPCW